MSTNPSYDQPSYDYVLRSVTLEGVCDGPNIRALQLSKIVQEKNDRNRTWIYVNDQRQVEREDTRTLRPGVVIGYFERSSLWRLNTIVDETEVPALADRRIVSNDEIFEAWKGAVVRKANEERCFEEVFF